MMEAGVSPRDMLLSSDASEQARYSYTVSQEEQELKQPFAPLLKVDSSRLVITK
jgi:hypothetical protein